MANSAHRVMPDEFWRGFFRGAPHGVVVLGAVRNERDRVRDFEWVDMNAPAAEVLRCVPNDLLGRRLRDRYPDHLDPRLFRRLLAVMHSGVAMEFERALPLPRGAAGDGRPCGEVSAPPGPDVAWYAVTLVPVEQEYVVAEFRSITDYKNVLRQAVELMNHDDLTGLANRRHLKSRFWVLRKRRVPMAVLYFDLNGFKRINDDHGHELGDKVLSVIGQRLKQGVRPGEMVARIGGDEFAVLLADAEMGTLDRVAERLMQALEEPVHLAHLTVHISASVGAALYPDDAESFEALLSQADERMYEHKRRRQGAR